MDVADIDWETCDLSVKNPNKAEEIALRDPQKILDVTYINRLRGCIDGLSSLGVGVYVFCAVSPKQAERFGEVVFEADCQVEDWANFLR